MYYSDDKDEDKYENLIYNAIKDTNPECPQDHIHYAAGTAFVFVAAWFNFIMFILRNTKMYIRLPFPTTFALLAVSIAWALYALINKEDAFCYYEKFFKYTLPAILLLFCGAFPFVLVIIFARIQDLLFGG